MDVREKLFTLFQDCNNPSWKWFPNNAEMLKLIDYLIANGVTVQDWISVNDERKPEDRRNYFIAYVFGDSDMQFFGEAKYHAYEGNGIVDRPHFSNEGVNGMRVTHWMEIPKLPQPPKGE